jgi:hypothetical protein
MSVSVSLSPASGPQLPPAALHGLPGEVVRAIEPHTEGDPAALLVTYLVMLGNACGPQPSVQVGAGSHPGRLFALIVGDSATGRKGTAASEVERLFEQADPDWYDDRVERGIQSAPALVARAGDSRDPRLLVLELEFGRLLAAMAYRPDLGNKLKDAWDTGNLSTTTKDLSSRRIARGAHISVIGHVTGAELAHRMTRTDLEGGFGNRFLYVVARRSKLLPRGGSLDLDLVDKLADQTADVIGFAHTVALADLDPVSRALCDYHGTYPLVPLQRTAAFWDLWDQLYGGAFEERPAGQAGAVTSRTAAQVLRLAVTYALADQTTAVGLPHLEAAHAVWRFCRESAAAIFGTVTGNRDSDRFLAELERGPLSRRDLSILFQRHKSQRQLDEVVAAAQAVADIDEYTVTGTGGRPALMYQLSPATGTASSTT